MKHDTSDHLFLGKNRATGAWEFLTPEERRRHLYVVGQTGTGKTTFLKSLFMQDVMTSRGATFIDPHGDAASDLANAIPPHRLGDVIYFDPSDATCPLGFNPFDRVPAEHRSQAVSSLMACFESQWSNSWGPRLSYILRHCFTALMECPPQSNHTLLSIPRLLTDKAFRTRTLRHVTDPVCASFWRSEFTAWDNRQRAEAISPILNKAGAYAAHAKLRRVLGQARSSFRISDVMDKRRLLVINLNKGALGDDGVSLIGALIVASLQHIAYRRSAIAEDQRIDHALYIDEFQSFSSPNTFASLFSEARKYRLSLTVGHQFLAQLEPKVFSAVTGNVGTLACFSVGTSDADILAGQYRPLNPDELVSSGRGECVLRLRRDGQLLDPIQLASIYENWALGSFENVLKQTRRRYGKDACGREIEARIAQQYIKPG